MLFCACDIETNTETSTESIAISTPDSYQIEKVLAKTLNAWYPRTIDTIYGGFKTNFSYRWEPLSRQDKMIVTQARHLWTLSKIAAFFPDSVQYMNAAQHAYMFLSTKMRDAQNKGYFWMVNQEGQPLLDGYPNLFKRTYGNAFALYALAAYYELTYDPKVLLLAQELFKWLESYAHDEMYGGYYSTLNISGEVLDSSMFADQFPSSYFFYKDQNTSIHILEAFTELYSVWPNELLKERLTEMFHLIRDRMVDERGYLRLYFYNNWTPISFQDSSLGVQEKNYDLDHVSFGHDIETAYLLLEASEALNHYQYDGTMKVAKKMVDHTLRWGIDSIRSGIYDRGYYTQGFSQMKIVSPLKNWWSQAEGLNALYQFSKLYPDQQLYAQAYMKLWVYTQDHVIDPNYYGWYPDGTDTHPESAFAPKASPWKGNYHTVRSLLNLMHNQEH